MKATEHLDLKRHLARVVVCYFSLAFVLSLLLGVFRTIHLMHSSGEANPYPLDTVCANAGLALLAGLAAVPFLLAVYFAVPRVRNAAPATTASLGSLLGIIPGFFWLTTPIGFSEPVLADPQLLLKQALLWGALIALVAGFWWAIFVSRSSRAVVVRSAVTIAGLSLVTAAIGLYSFIADSSAHASFKVEASAKYKPDVFIILVDTLRADHLSSYGYDRPTSPNVDAFARSGTLYTRAIAAASWTKPSCAALLTSLYPPDMEMKDEFAALPPKVPILPQFLKGEGYATAGIISSVWISRVFGFDKGFDLLDLGKTKFHWSGLKRPLVRLGLVEPGHSYPRFDAQELTDRAIQWIGEQGKRSRPLFMYLHYADPHAPYSPPPDQDRWREFAGPAGRSVKVPPDNPPRDGRILSEAELDALRARYDAEIAFFDKNFGRLIGYLKETGRYTDSLIILTADHGEEFFDHGGFGHSMTLYNELLRVPLIVKLPGNPSSAKGRTDRLVSLVDVSRTVADVLQARWDTSAWRGKSLLRGNPDEFTYSETDTTKLRAIISGPNKLIQKLDENDDVVGEKYYSFSSDFHEHGDGVAPPTVSPQTLDAMRKTMADIGTDNRASIEVKVDDDTLEHLRALGYVK